MFQKEKVLYWLLPLVLAVCLGVGILADPNTWSTTASSGEYHVQISEICTKNESIIPDNDGKYRDYIELYNAGEAVDLTGCRLTDGSTRSDSLQNLILEAGGYRVIFLGKDTTGFALAASGKDSIQLQSPTGSIITQVKLRAMEEDQVMVLKNGAYQLSNTPTPGFSNDQAGEKAYKTGEEKQDLSVTISEVMLENDAFLADEKGGYSDVVELHNPTSQPIHLGGWCLSDDVTNRFRFRLPEVTLAADSYLLIFCDGEGYTTESGIIHSSFGLAGDETLYLTDPTGAYCALKLTYTGKDTSYARTEEGYVVMSPSLGYPNDEEGCYAAIQARVDPDAPLVINEVLLSDAGVPYEGKLQDVVEIRNRSTEKVSTKGWYLSDGNDPYGCPLPEMTLSGGEFMIIPVSKATTGFGLAAGEMVYLISPDHSWSQPVSCVLPEEGKSIALVAGTDGYEITAPSLGYDNGKAGQEAFVESQLQGNLRISEVMASNSSYLSGPYGNTTDWVELYNAGKETISLADYCLTDSSDLGKYTLPDKKLAPGSYIVILLSESGRRLKAGYGWLPFSISAAGDRLYLSKEGQVLDYVVIPELPSDTAWGRPKGHLVFAQLAEATPGSTNSAAAKVSAAPVASLPQGSYDGVDSITVTFRAKGDIYYTTDCTAPTKSDKKYTGPITLRKTTVLRVAAYEKGASRSQVLDLTYLINENDSLGAVCLVTDPDNLWDYDSGIYVKGPNASATSPYHGANFWKNVEKSASVSLFETDGSLGFSENCGLKIFGGYSRANGKKSLACMFRGTYGASSLDYALFGDAGINNFQSFVLRAGGQDAYTSKIRDEMITSLASEHLGLPVQRYRATVLYLNGEYWGIYFIREKLTDQYVAGNYGVYEEDVTLSNWSGSSCKPYRDLQNYAKDHDLSKQEHYDYVCSQINVDNYIDYIITQMWIANTDLGNVKFFKTTEMPWHWALFDTDLSFRRVSHASVSNIMNKRIYIRDISSSTLVIRLMKNPEFKEKFLRRMAWQLENVWTEENVVNRVNEFQALLQPDMAKECKRWGGSVSNWENNLQSLRSFAAKRNSYFLEDVQDYFNLSKQKMQEYGFEV